MRSICAVSWYDEVMKINYTASEQVRNVIESLGRTEDIKFSPNNKRLAVAGYNRKRIAVFDLGFNTHFALAGLQDFLGEIQAQSGR